MATSKPVDLNAIVREILLDTTRSTVVQGFFTMWKGKPKEVVLIVDRKRKRGTIQWYYNKKWEPASIGFHEKYWIGSPYLDEAGEDDLLDLLFPTEE